MPFIQKGTPYLKGKPQYHKTQLRALPRRPAVNQIDTNDF
jgi:hypothetical protein